VASTLGLIFFLFLARTRTVKTKQIATFLRTVSIFHELPEEQLNRVAQSAEQISFRPGEQIQNRFGEEPTLVVMVEGECQAYLEQGELDLELEVQRLYPGDFIGAEAVVDGRASTATVRSVTAGRAVVLRKEIVAELLEQEPSFSKALCHTFATALQQGLRHNNSIRFAYLSSFPDASSTVRLLPRRISSVSRSLVVESQRRTRHGRDGRSQ
jgi:CRP-like cAMP-binding protein